MIKYEVRILIDFSLCYFSPKAWLPPTVSWEFCDPVPKQHPRDAKHHVTMPPIPAPPPPRPQGANCEKQSQRPHLAPGRLPAATQAAVQLRHLRRSGYLGAFGFLFDKNSVVMARGVWVGGGWVEVGKRGNGGTTLIVSTINQSIKSQ